MQGEISEKIRSFVREFARANNYVFFDIKVQAGFLRTLTIRTSSTGEIMVILQFFKDQTDAREELMNAIAENFPQITSLIYFINPKGNDTFHDLKVNVVKGRDYIFESMENLQFKIGPKSFYQTNSTQAYELYKVTREFANLNGTENVYDLYTGTGTIALFISKYAKKVIGIEMIAAAIEDAKENAKLNKIDNAEFFAADMKDIFNDAFIAKHGQPDVIITDPPRVGMHEDVVRCMARSGASKIVYVSCNPASQSRDLAILDEKYKIVKVQPVDMFPQTHHVENVVLLELK